MTRSTWLAVLLLALSSSLAGCVLGQCTAVCADPYTVSFVDGAGSPVTDAFGFVTTASGETVAFDCAGGHLLDAGTPLMCTANSITLQSTSDLRAFSVSAEASGNRRFSGLVTATWVPSGTRVCGADCQVGTATVVLQ